MELGSFYWPNNHRQVIRVRIPKKLRILEIMSLGMRQQDPFKFRRVRDTPSDYAMDSIYET